MQKGQLEKEKKDMEDKAAEIEKIRDMKLKSIGNYVHESVPVENNEVCARREACSTDQADTDAVSACI